MKESTAYSQQVQMQDSTINNLLVSCLKLNIYRKTDAQTSHQKKNTIIAIFILRYCFILQGIIGLFSHLNNFKLTRILVSPYVIIFYRCMQSIILFFQLSFIGLMLYAVFKVQITKQLQRIIKTFINSSDLISQLVLNLSGILIATSWSENMGIFVLAIIVNTCQVLFFSNYLIRKETFYCSSQLANLIYKYIFILGYFLNACLTNSQLFCSSLLIQFIIFLLWYLFIGFRLYIYSIPKNCLNIFISSYSVLVYLVIQTIMGQNISDLQLEISKMVLLFIAMLYFIQMYQKKTALISNKINKNRKTKLLDLFLFSLMQKDPRGEKIHPILAGLLQFHKENQCINLHCYSHLKQIYDPVCKQKIKIEDICKYKQVIFRHYIKCLYEKEIILKKKNGDLYAEYAQFLLNQHYNPFSVSIFCKKSQQMKISFLTSIKLISINQINQNNINLMNKTIYLGIQLENIIKSQYIYDKIQNQIEKYLDANMQILNLFNHNEIDLSFLKNEVQFSYKIISTLDQNWQQLKIYFKHQKQWVYVYLNYCFFIKNEKIKNKLLSQLGFQGDRDQIFRTTKVQFTKGCKQTDYYNNKLMFHPDSLVVQAIYQNKHLIITKINQYSKRIMGYSQSQLAGCQLSCILPKNLGQDHDNKFYEWASSGYFTNQQSYHIKSTYILNKQGVEIGVLKYFKMFINQAQGVQYIALLKADIQPVQIQQAHQINIELNQCQISKQDRNSTTQANRICKNNKNQRPSNRRKWNSISEDNIFMKDQANQPVKQLKQITYIKMLVRLFNVSLLMTIVFLAILISKKDGTKLVNYSSGYISFMQTYRIPMILGGSYFRNMLKIGNQTRILTQIKSLSAQLTQVSQLPLTLTTLFDPVINEKKLFGPYQYNQINRNLTYDQVELFYLINSCIMTLSANTIKFNSPQFTLFNSYINPGYDNLLNSTKNNFHHSFQNIFLTIKAQEKMVSILQTVLFAVFILLQIWIICIFFKKLKELIQIIVQLKDVDLAEMHQYWGQLFLLFENMKLKQKKISNQIIEQSFQKRKKQFNLKQARIIQTEQNFTGKKIKTLIHHKQQKRFRRKLVLLVFLGMTVSTGILLLIQNIIITEVNKLIIFQNDGFSFLKYFPTATIVGYGCFQKYYSIQNPGQIVFQPTRYQDVLSSMLLVGKFQFISEVKDSSSSYYQKQKNYFFGNPCRFNPSVLVGVGINITQCQTIINASFTMGLAAYMRAGYDIAQKYLFGSSTLTASQINDFSVSVAVLSGYILDAIVTWGTEFNIRVNNYMNVVYSISVVNAILVVLLHIIIFEWLVFAQMMKEFTFYRQIYNGMMPQYILIKQKVTRQQLIKIGFILQ